MVEIKFLDVHHALYIQVQVEIETFIKKIFRR